MASRAPIQTVSPRDQQQAHEAQPLGRRQQVLAGQNGIEDVGVDLDSRRQPVLRRKESEERRRVAVVDVIGTEQHDLAADPIAQLLQHCRRAIRR